jgi:hypothetical protein
MSVTEMEKDIAAELLNQNVVIRQRECPVCGECDRSALFMDFQSERYVGAVAKSLKISEAALFDCLEGQKCSSCGATYFDPWFSVRLQKRLYEKLYPQHNFGWNLFWSSIKDPSAVSGCADLYKSFKRIIPNFRTYGELGCPFTGLLPYLSMKEYTFRSRHFCDYPGAYIFNTPVGLHPQLGRIRLICDQLSNAFLKTVNRLHLLRCFSLKRLIMRGIVRTGMAQPVNTEPIDRYFISCNSSILWGKNCQSLNVQCETALQNVFGAAIVGLDDLKMEKLHFDLIGIYNSLDHYKNPLGLLRKLFEFAGYIYLEGHYREGSNGKQHLYFFEPATIEALPKLLPMAEAVPNVNRNLPEHWYSVLLKRVK